MGAALQVIEKQVGGHITLLFSIQSDPHRLSRQGSRGAGFCIGDGVLVRIWNEVGNSEKYSFSCNIKDMNGKEVPKHCVEQYSMALKELDLVGLIPHHGQEIKAEIALQLPMSQGFGMSAAGLYAFCQALAELYNFSNDEIPVRISHRIERIRSSGLGDILALYTGGVELRLEPGAPPHPGFAVSFSARSPVALIWTSNEKRHTKGYIDDTEWKKMITIAGDDSVSRLKQGEWESSRWEELLDEADLFSTESKLIFEDSRAKIFADVKGTIIELGLDDVVRPVLCMLGTSIAILPQDLDFLPSEVSLAGLIDALIGQGYCGKISSLL